jgi:NAD(P)-dependent dehydrogenase (short-subunit alcohol dehydrogenase family)
MKLKGKHIVITGGGRGIGATIARMLLSEGADVAISSRSESELQRTASELEKASGRKVLAVPCDVGNREDVLSLFSAIRKSWPSIDGLVCAAGIYGPIGPLEELSLEEWEQAIEVNLMGTVRCVHAVLPEMKRRREGRIVLFSGGGVAGFPRFSAYATSKGGIWRFTETLGMELAPYRVYLNAIAPGAVNTKFLDDLIKTGPEKVGESFYKKALEQKEKGGTPPEKAGELVRYLMSEESRGLYGKILSATWDKYWEIDDPEKVSASSLYTMRRVITPEGGTS